MFYGFGYLSTPATTVDGRVEGWLFAFKKKADRDEWVGRQHQRAVVTTKALPQGWTVKRAKIIKHYTH